jgi:hypothetical protein
MYEWVASRLLQGGATVSILFIHHSQSGGREGQRHEIQNKSELCIRPIEIVKKCNIRTEDYIKEKKQEKRIIKLLIQYILGNLKNRGECGIE